MADEDSRPIFWMLVDSALGALGLAWSDRGLVRLHLPAGDPDATRRRLLASLGSRLKRQAGADETPAFIRQLTIDLRSYAEGRAVDFRHVPLDLDGVDPFRLDIYEAARRLDFGTVCTYGELAVSAGHPGQARETGAALGANPVPLVVPCHRILAAGGKLGGFSAPGGTLTKERLLTLEGVRTTPPPPAQAAFAF